jgi:hypothetical protein
MLFVCRVGANQTVGAQQGVGAKQGVGAIHGIGRATITRSTAHESGSTYAGGRGGKERAASLRAEQRLAPGGAAPCPKYATGADPRPGLVAGAAPCPKQGLGAAPCPKQHVGAAPCPKYA